MKNNGRIMKHDTLLLIGIFLCLLFFGFMNYHYRDMDPNYFAHYHYDDVCYNFEHSCKTSIVSNLKLHHFN